MDMKNPQKKSPFRSLFNLLKTFYRKLIMFKKLLKVPFNRVFIVRASHATKTWLLAAVAIICSLKSLL
ncbi:hypothetical protein EGH90_00405 [Kaistella haifensis]|nr:hypothetical protein EGH90_00405 [Kaistella haifensis]